MDTTGEARSGPPLARFVWGAAALVGPFALLAAAAGAWRAWGEVRANGYLDEGLGYVAAELFATEVRHAVLVALAGAVPALLALGWLAARRARMDRLWPWGVALQACVAPAYLWFWADWRVVRPRSGIDVPDLYWRRGELVQWAVACGVILLAALAVHLLRRGGPDAGWPGRRWSRFGVATAVPALAALLAATQVHRLAQPSPSAGYNVVFVTWDSTRADHLSAYGYERPTTPHVAALAADAVLYERAYSQHNWTRPSYASIMTSLHQWEYRSGDFSRHELTLAEALKQAGYRTAAFTQNANLDPRFGFDQGFDAYSLVHFDLHPVGVAEMAGAAIDELASGDRPFFLFVHFEEPHWPYRTEGPFVDEFRRESDVHFTRKEIHEMVLKRLEDWDPDDPETPHKMRFLLDVYDADIRRTDEGFGAIVAHLRERGLLENTLFVFNSDHGDEFFDHGSVGHGHRNVYAELTRIPFLVRYPDALGVEPRLEARPVANLDIFPTVLDVLGLPVPAHLSGRSLLELEDDERVILSNHGSMLAVRSGSRSMIIDYAEGTPEGFDLSRDLAELQPLVGSAGVFAPLLTIADHWYQTENGRWKGEQAKNPEELDEELRKRLQALGYL